MSEEPLPTIFERLAALYPQAKKTTLREMLEGKRVLINGVPARSLKQPVGEKDKVEVLDVADVPVKTTTLGEGLKMVHFDSEVIVVEKPHGLLTSTDAEERRPTAWRILQAWFRKQNNKNQVHLIHRLDRDASGLLVFARTWDAYSSLKTQFFEHTITRQYDVLVHGVPKGKKGRLENLLIEQEGGVVKVTRDLKAGKLAILDYELVGTDAAKKISHLKCTLFTGRKHQIRVQLAAMGHKVLGDPVYGKAEEPPGRLALHAAVLAFAHPRTRKEVKFVSPMPGGFAHLVR
jgi:RluA family pseudouridine synthase